MKKSTNVFEEDEVIDSPDIPLIDYLQLLHNSNKTCTVRVKSDRAGLVSLSNGRLTSAKTGRLLSQEALYEMFGWSGCTYVLLDYIEPRANESISIGVMEIIFEYTKEKDERCV
jgi:hypothetical protein